MSIRTIVEINHDQLPHLIAQDAVPVLTLLRQLRESMPTATEAVFFESRGMRILGQRHHSEPQYALPESDPVRTLLSEVFKRMEELVAPGAESALMLRMRAALMDGSGATQDPPVPVAKIAVDEEGKVACAELYAPGLPAGKYDLFLECSVAEHRPAQAEIERPSLSSLRGMAQGAYGGLSSTDHVERVRRGEL